MKTPEEIEILAIEHCKNIKGSCDEGNNFSSYIEGYSKCQEETEKVICLSCNKPISVNNINKHLFMKVQGGLIHWKCN